MIDELERDLAVTELYNYVDDVTQRDPDRARAVYLVFFNLLERTSLVQELASTVSRVWQNVYSAHQETAASALSAPVKVPPLAPDELRSRLRELVTNAVESAMAAPGTVYTTGQVARAVGVSITAVRKWIESGRIRPTYQEEQNKRIVIPADAKWRAPNGHVFRIGDLIERAEQKSGHAGHPKSTSLVAETGRGYLISAEDSPQKAEERRAAGEQLAHFETQYGGPYEETLGRRIETGGPLTAAEQTDSAEWRFLLRVLGRNVHAK